MMDQQNFEATRPVSADPAVALAEMLGQLPKPTAESRPARKAADRRQDLGRGSRRGTRPQARRPERADHPPHQARQGLFIRSRQRHADPPCRHHPPPALDGGAAGLSRRALFGRSELASAGRRHRCRRPAAIPLSRRLGKGPRAAQGASPGAGWSARCRRSAATSRHLVRRRADARIRAVGRDRADRAHRDPSRQRILCPPQRHPRRHHDAEVQRHAGRRQLRADLQGQGRQGRAQGMRRRQAGARHRHPAAPCRASACSSIATIPAPCARSRPRR